MYLPATSIAFGRSSPPRAFDTRPSTSHAPRTAKPFSSISIPLVSSVGSRLAPAPPFFGLWLRRFYSAARQRSDPRIRRWRQPRGRASEPRGPRHPRLPRQLLRRACNLRHAELLPLESRLGAHVN